MNKEARRGFVPEDENDFKNIQLEKLHKAADELYYLLNRNYQIKNASTFIGNHYLLSERQRLALTRTVSTASDIKLRKDKQIQISLPAKKLTISDGFIPGESIPEVSIDGFNTIITLEVALSGSPLLACMDGTIRDLAGLRGTYRLIDKTDTAVELLLKWLDDRRILKADIYLDAPVSNSGRLKMLIAEKAQKFRVKTNIQVICDVDRVLEKLPFVVTSDAIILNKCQSWINMCGDILDNDIEGSWRITL